LWPIVGILQYSFYDWDGFSPRDNFIGFGNYKELLIDPYFWNAVRNAMILAFSHIFIEIPITLLFGVLLTRAYVRAKSVFRMLLFFPVVTTTAVVGIIFTIILNPVGGPISEILLQSKLIGSPINFLGSNDLALSTLISVSIWKHFGISLIYWTAALQTIPNELYEASRMDGSNSFQELLYITIPLVLPYGVIIMLLTFTHAINPFDLVQTLTAGGPNFTTDVVDTYIYRNAFNSSGSIPRHGLASAAGVSFSLIVIIMTIVGVLIRNYTVKKDSATGGISR
jgi:multiple sugar transport system permease protein